MDDIEEKKIPSPQQQISLSKNYVIAVEIKAIFQNALFVYEPPPKTNFCGTDMSTCQKCLMQLLNP